MKKFVPIETGSELTGKLGTNGPKITLGMTVEW